MEEFYNKYYLKMREDNSIIDAFSNGPFYNRSTDDYICFNEKGSYQLRLFPDGEENPQLFTEDGIPLYKYENEKVLHRTDGEIKVERALNLNKQLPYLKQEKINQSKQQLADFLANHALTWSDGKQYSVTQEKQAMLAEQLSLYSLDHNVTLYWNAKGEERTEWQIEDLINLGKAIIEYVHPYILYQQQKELEIKNAEFVEDLDSIVIDYDSVSPKKLGKNV